MTKNTERDYERLPKHIAMIMDGNRTWAKNRGLEPIEGHKQLVVALDKVIKYSYELKIEQITFYAFSTENWKRSEYEVNYLMELYNEFISNFPSSYLNIKFRLLGNKDRLPEYLKKTINMVEEKTKNNSNMVFNMALNYGGRDEIVNATKSVVKNVIENKISINEINENMFEKYLYTQGNISPDLMIRTSGQIRLSNYLMWQLAYAELYFTNTYWPDFNEQELDKAIIEYQKRTRKFGGN